MESVFRLDLVVGLENVADVRWKNIVGILRLERVEFNWSGDVRVMIRLVLNVSWNRKTRRVGIDPLAFSEVAPMRAILTENHIIIWPFGSSIAPMCGGQHLFFLVPVRCVWIVDRREIVIWVFFFFFVPVVGCDVEFLSVMWK